MKRSRHKPANVYLVLFYDLGGVHVQGVFSSKAEAKGFMKDQGLVGHNFGIEMWVLDSGEEGVELG